ncbi:putative ribonuclease H domain, reverse transcriptase zinc-binding domain-containing protein [Arabidopsis thaliana]
MSCFLLPQTIINKLRRAIAKFWWSTKNNNRGLHWLAWDKVCIPLEDGGLGFRDFKEFNIALLAKQLWRILRYPNSLLSRVLKVELIQAIIDPSDIPLILSLKPSRRFQVDDFCWIYTKSGHYTVKSGYLRATQWNDEENEVTEPSTKILKKQVWKVKTARKIKHFLWQALSGCLATSSRLVDRHCGSDRTCMRCGGVSESINHLLFECPPAMQVWALSNIPTNPGIFPSTSIFTNFDFLLWRAKDLGATKEILEAFPWILWYVWKARNDKIFNNKDILPPDTLQLAISEATNWRLAQIIEQSAENEEESPTMLQAIPNNNGQLRCQVDASWVADGYTSGLIFVIDTPSGILLGSRGKSRALSPLQAELEALTWAMDSALLRGLDSVHFNTDCSALVKIIEEEDSGPIFETETEFFNLIRNRFRCFSISHVSRTLNIRADTLAKGARSRDLIFSHVSFEVPKWLVLATNFFEPN